MNITKLNLLLSTCCIAILLSCSTKYAQSATKQNEIIKADLLSVEIQRLGLEFTKKNNVSGIARSCY